MRTLRKHLCEHCQKILDEHVAAKEQTPDIKTTTIGDAQSTATLLTAAGTTLNQGLVLKKISEIFITLGIPAHIKGYQFLREAIIMTIKKPTIINYITRELYPAVAQLYGTSPSKVERAIRHAIEVGWSRGRIENLNQIFGVKVYGNHDRPTNGEFIALLADKMLIDGAS